MDAKRQKYLKDKKMVWINKDLLKQVDKWTRKNTPLGERISLQASIEHLVKTHPDIAQQSQ